MNVSRRGILSAMAALPLTSTVTPALATPLPTALSYSAKPAVFFVPHQDDELLSQGSAIVEHVNAGRETHVILVGRGDQTIVRTRDMPPLLGYTPTEFHMGSVRDREFRLTVETLGAIPHVATFEQRLSEKVFTVQQCMDFVRMWLPLFPGADVKAHSEFASNPDHANLGKAVRLLRANGELAWAPRFYVSPWDRGTIAMPKLGRTIRTMPTNAQYFYRRVDLFREMWGVGYKSVPRYFQAHAADPSSYWHA